MSLFRSAPMRYYQLFIPTEEAYNVVSKVAPESFVQFLDASPNNFHKPYYNDIRRCEDVINKIDHILKQVRKYKIPLPEMPEIDRIFKIADSSTYLSIQSSKKGTSTNKHSSTKYKIKQTKSIKEQKSPSETWKMHKEKSWTQKTTNTYCSKPEKSSATRHKKMNQVRSTSPKPPQNNSDWSTSQESFLQKICSNLEE